MFSVVVYLNGVPDRRSSVVAQYVLTVVRDALARGQHAEVFGAQGKRVPLHRLERHAAAEAKAKPRTK